jgi:hypothetical protein
VLAEAEHVEPDLVGQFDLFDEIAQALVRRYRAWPVVEADVGEGVEAEFHSFSLDCSTPQVAARRGNRQYLSGEQSIQGRRETVPLRQHSGRFHGWHADLTLELSAIARM